MSNSVEKETDAFLQWPVRIRSREGSRVPSELLVSCSVAFSVGIRASVTESEPRSSPPEPKSTWCNGHRVTVKKKVFTIHKNSVANVCIVF